MPTEHHASADAEVVLPRRGVYQRTAKIGHEVVCFKDAPGHIFQQDHVHTTSRSHGKRALSRIARYLRSGVRRAKQEFRERHEVIETPEVQARTE